jgi:translin
VKPVDQLEQISNSIREYMEAVNDARDEAYQRSRELTSECSRAIRAIHREEWDLAHRLMEQARSQARDMVDGVKGYPELYYAGYTQDALKEFVEAYLTYALVRNQPLPPPGELDIIRHGYRDEVERLLDQMDEIYSILVTFDFSDSITAGLRRRTDVLRGVLERTRGDVTTSLRQAELEQALEALERKLGNV